MNPYPTETPTTSEPEPNVEWESLGTFTITHYCTEGYRHICNNGLPLRTFTGNTPIPYSTIAVDPNLIPLGSIVLIDGKEYLADDIGGGINGRHIDICVTYHEEALQLGRKEIEVFVKKTP
jgi:3D (Asp-Asp-Asp) domain-containing protein